MIKRATQRPIPTSDRMIEIETSCGDVCFRVPGYRARAPLGAMSKDDPALLGCLIGLGWADRDHDLEAEQPDHRAPVAAWQAYGDAVLMELDDADWIPAAVDGIAAILLAKWSERMMVHAEARERADFFTLKRGALPTQK